VASRVPSGLNARACTSFVWPLKVRRPESRAASLPVWFIAVARSTQRGKGKRSEARSRSTGFLTWLSLGSHRPVASSSRARVGRRLAGSAVPARTVPGACPSPCRAGRGVVPYLAEPARSWPMPAEGTSDSACPPQRLAGLGPHPQSPRGERSPTAPARRAATEISQLTKGNR
jgi:hypothetical protein